MFRFEHSYILWGLALVPIFLLLFIAIKSWRKKSREKFAEHDLFVHLMPEYSNFRYNAKFVLFLIGYGLTGDRYC